MSVKLIDAMRALGVGGYIKNNDFDSIVWANPSETVSKEVLEAKVKELQNAEDLIAYKEKRKLKYPSIEDCVHALLDGGKTLKDLQTKRSEIKNKYPKPKK